MDDSFVGVIAGFLIAVLGQGLIQVSHARQAEKEREHNFRQLESDRKEARRQAIIDRLCQSLDTLVELRGIINFKEGREAGAKEVFRAYGKAFAILRSINDDKLRTLANDFYNAEDLAERSKAIDTAIGRMGEIIDREMRGNGN